MHRMNLGIFQRKHAAVFDMRLNEGYLEKELRGLEKNFLMPFWKKLEGHDQIKSWSLWNMKSLVLQFYRILNSMAFRLGEAVVRNRDAEDPSIFPFARERRNAIWSIFLNSFVVTFGVCLSAPLQK